MTRLIVSCFLSLSLLAQIPEQVESSVVATGMRYPAGLAWSHEGFLVIGDSEQREIYRLDPKQRPKPTRQDANGPQGLAWDAQGRLYICETTTRQLARMDRRGAIAPFATAFEGKKFNGPSEVTVRKDGQVYFTDPAFASAIDRRELDFNGVFHVNGHGDVEALARWKTRPNGIALSPDGKKLYVSDADRHAIVQFDLDSKGAATASHDFITGIRGVPAGLCSDATGQLFVAAAGLAIYSPEGKLGRTLMDTRRVLGCAFGGATLDSLYVSTPKEVYELKIGVKGVLQN